MPVVPQITIYVVLVWFLWRFFIAIGWVLGTWIINQVLAEFGGRHRRDVRSEPIRRLRTCKLTSLEEPRRQSLDIFLNFHSFVGRGARHALSAIDAAQLWRGRQTILPELQAANVYDEAQPGRRSRS
jgi:hypothetical protein